MRRKLSVLSLTVVAMLVVSTLPAAAHSSQTAEGEWDYVTSLTDVQEYGCATVMRFTENDKFSGTLTGGSLEEPSGHGVIVVDCSGNLRYWGLLRFEEMTVDGKTGGLVMAVGGRLSAEPGSEWTGRWVIVNATAELEGLRGQGNWWGPGAGGSGLLGSVEYEGKVHFDPNS